MINILLVFSGTYEFIGYNRIDTTNKRRAPPPQLQGRGGAEGESGPRRAKGNSLARLNRLK